MRPTKHTILFITSLATVEFLTIGVFIPQASADQTNSVQYQLGEISDSTAAIQAKTDALPDEPADQFKTGVTKAIRGSVKVDPYSTATSRCSTTYIINEGADKVISGRIGVVLTRTGTDLVIAEGGVGGVRFSAGIAGQYADEPAVKINTDFISDNGTFAITVCDEPTDGEDPEDEVRYAAFYTVTGNVTDGP